MKYHLYKHDPVMIFDHNCLLGNWSIDQTEKTSRIMLSKQVSAQNETY